MDLRICLLKPDAAPSSSLVQDTRFSSWERGFKSRWGHFERRSELRFERLFVFVFTLDDFDSSADRVVVEASS